MFDPCPKTKSKTCGFATTTKDGKDTYCGLATGVDARVSQLPKCWKNMTKYEQTKLLKGTYWGY